MISDTLRMETISEDYADFIVEYFGDLSLLEPFGPGNYRILNHAYAIVHRPLSEFNEQTIRELGYSALPLLYGISSAESLEASGINRIRNVPNFDLRGQGVLIGIVDTGVDYQNQIFRYGDGSSRIINIWDQTIQSDDFPINFGYGTRYNRERINQALQSDNPLEIVPSTDTNGHGTMVAGIAGGNEVPDSDFYGIASEAEFIIVKVKQAKQYLRNFFFIPEGVDCFQNTDILLGMQYIVEVAAELRRSVVICIALGSSQGAHDGQDILSSAVTFRSTVPGTAIVVAAGNEGNLRSHYSGRVNRAIGYDTVELNVGENVAGFSMELWGQSPSQLTIDLLSPSGEFIPRISPRYPENTILNFVFESTTIYIDFLLIESQTGEQLILIRFNRPAAGIWRIRVYEGGDLNLGFNIWLPMRSFLPADTYFIRSNPYTTLLALGNAAGPITTTAYNVSDNSLYLDASRGFTRTEEIKPEIAAPGVNVIGPTLNGGFAPFTGSSVAAAHTTGVAAMLMEWGVVEGNLIYMSTVEMKKLMIRGARRDPNIIYPNREWGYGILDIYNVYESLRSGVLQ